MNPPYIPKLHLVVYYYSNKMLNSVYSRSESISIPLGFFLQPASLTCFSEEAGLYKDVFHIYKGLAWPQLSNLCKGLFQDHGACF